MPPRSQKPKPAVKNPPWLMQAGLLNDGSVDAATEIEAFCKFVSATETERARRTALRTTLQAVAQMHIPEATIKIIGSCATGLDTFGSGLDLVVETPSVPPTDPQVSFKTALDNLGVPTSMIPGGDGLIVPAAALSKLAAGWANAKFDATVRFRVGHCTERAAVSLISSYFKTYPRHRQVVIVIRAVLRQMNLIDNVSGLPSHAVTIMAVALFEKMKDGPSFPDIGWVLREFFRFYAGFDFDAQTITISKTDEQTATFVAKTHSDPLSICDLVNPSLNCTSSTKKLPQLKAMFHYVTTCIQRFDRVGTRSLLANFVAHNELWDRYETLKQTSGAYRITKDFAMELVTSMTQMLKDPAYAEIRTSFMEASQRDGGSIGENLKEAFLTFTAGHELVSRRLMENPRSKLAPFKDNIPGLADGVMAYKDEPEMKQAIGVMLFPHSGSKPSEGGWKPWGKDPPSKEQEEKLTLEDVVDLMSRIADFVSDHPESMEELEVMLENGGIDAFKGRIAQQVIATRAAEKPDTKLMKYKDNADLLLDSVFEFIDNPQVQEHLLRVVTLNAIITKIKKAKHADPMHPGSQPSSPSARPATAIPAEPVPT
eukprot:TRINITY_DN4656_c0_g3_i2.p1 TRINITY_DN4656_c0_g3~~TRINITY_DN4656_c0_g3_i2.p1  ORF type:complete len:613 (+),score=95.31 TRINITY_DN4656_c0_g3_i2:47-1840(+)